MEFQLGHFEFGRSRIAFVKRNLPQLALLGMAGLLLCVSADSWVRYIGNGIAYGGLVGLSGYEQELARYGSKAIKFLKIALCSEALAIAVVSWAFIAVRRPRGIRLGIALALAVVGDACTYSVVRG